MWPGPRDDLVLSLGKGVQAGGEAGGGSCHYKLCDASGTQNYPGAMGVGLEMAPPSGRFVICRGLTSWLFALRGYDMMQKWLPRAQPLSPLRSELALPCPGLPHPEQHSLQYPRPLSLQICDPPADSL